MKMIDRVRYSLIFLAPVCVPHAALADASQVLKSWRTDAGWLTELRQHADGARVCATGKAFKEGHPFGLSIVKSGQITLVTLVDEGQPPNKNGTMQLSISGEALGHLSVTSVGAAFATTEEESEKTWSLISALPPKLLSIDVEGRRYQADLSGIDQARDQLTACGQLAMN